MKGKHLPIKTAAFLYFLFMSFCLNAQQVRSPWHIGARCAPEITWAQFKKGNAQKQYAKPDFGFTAEGSVVYALPRYIKLQTGIQFIQAGFGTSKDPSPDPPPGFFNPAIDKKTLYRYVGIPVGIQYEAGGRLRFSAGISLSFQYLMAMYSKTTYTTPGARQIFEHRGFYKQDPFFNIFPAVSAGIGYQFHEYAYLHISPVCRYSIFTLSASHPNTWNAGIDFGLFYILQDKQ